jgi:O-antigen/teichoic acid export membrane protein
MSIAKKIFYNTTWQIVLRFGEIILGVFTLGLITRLLGQTEYGYYTTIVAWLQFWIVLVDLGLYLTLLREISAHPEKETQTINAMVTLRLVTAVLFLALGIATVYLTQYPLAIKLGVALLAVSYLANSLITVLTALFQQRLRMPIVAAASLINKIILLLGILALAWRSDHLFAIVAISSAAAVINLLIVWIAAGRMVALRLNWNMKIWSALLIKTWPLAVTTALNLIYFKLDTLFMSWYRPASEVGLYGAGYRVLEIITTFPHMFMGLILPLLTAAWVAHDHQNLQKLWQRCFDFFAFLTLPLIAGTWVLATPIMVAIAGPDFAPSGPIVKILILATAAIFFGTLYTYLVIVFDRQKAMIPYFALAAFLSIIGYAITIPRYSYWGDAWMTVAIEISIIFFAWLTIRKQFAFQPHLTTTGKLLLASVIMALALQQLTFLPLVIQILIGAAVYSSVVIITKAFRWQDIRPLLFSTKS